MNRRQAAFAMALPTLLAGCATPPRPPSGLRAGRIAVRVESDGDAAARQFSASFELQGDASRGELRLFTPLGTTIGAARWREGEAALVTPDGETRYADLDTLSRDALGESLPLQALPDWLAGRPWPGAASELSATGFSQLGWQVDLSSHAEGRLLATRAMAPAVTVSVRLEPAP